ncbi:unnamed protein product [Symbiodinium sp. KB8]|nr:unnamed protein product [Symbiodinium sp. KB8]
MLPIYTPETGSIDLINWVTHITPIMEDLSDSSSMWWSSVLKEVMEWYSRYSVAAPLERVLMLPVISMMVNKPEWTRVERRATAMLLSAIPASLKEEVIAVGGVNTLNLLAKLFSTYQPGNRQEKALVLTNLEKPTECQDAASAVEALRKWALWRRRATAIGITEPDASVLLQGLDRICQGVVRADSELAFRVSLIRSTLQVDVCPTASGVTKFFQHLQAELEQQARLATVKQIAPTPKIKALTNNGEASSTPTTPAPPPKNQGVQCRFFASEKGCRRGSQCRYPHTWSAFDRSERAKRCLTCGAVGHKSKECRAPGGGAAAKPKDQQGAAAAKDPPATPSSAPSSTGSSPTTRRVTIEASSDIAMKVMNVLQEVKGMQALQPLVCAVERWSSMWGTKLYKRNALMDSGATHALRRPRDEKEWLDAVNVNVALAGEAKTTMRQTSNGTLLSGDELSQVIVPLGRVIDSLGYRLRWSANECSLEKEGEVLPLKVVRGCPEVESTAHRLIQELENHQLPSLQEATMESVKILKNVEVSWWSCMVDYAMNGHVDSGKEALQRALFFDERSREDLSQLLLRQPNDGGWAAMKDLGLNSSLLSAWRVLLWAATQGRIGAVISKDVGATVAEFEAHTAHRARVHFLHALSAAGQCYRGCALPKLLIERRRGATFESMDWMCGGKAQRYFDEMELPCPLFNEEESIEMVSGLTGYVSGDGSGRVRLARMSQDAAWRLHVMRNHQPFRRDCALCVRNAATGRQHRATLHPTGYTLSVDVAGPLKGFGKSPDGKYFKYFVIGAFRIPLLDGGVGTDEELRGYPIPPDDPADEGEEVLSEEELLEPPLEEEEDYPPVADDRKDQEEWEKLKEKFKAPLMTETLYFCVPVNSKKSLHVLPALQQMVVDVRGLGYPVYVKTKKYKTGDVESMHKSPGVRMKAMRLEGDYEDMVEALDQSQEGGDEESLAQEEIMLRVLKAQEKQAVEAVARELLNLGDFSKAACQRLLRALGFHTRWKTPRATVGKGMILGAFVHGGSFGITTHGRELPCTMRFLNKFLMIRLQGVMPGSTCTWTTLALQKANSIPAHRDVHNQRGTRNYVMEIADESLEGLWVEGNEDTHPIEGGDGYVQTHEVQLDDGRVIQGRVHSIDEPVAFDPRTKHALVNELGMKWVLSAYTPSGVPQLLQADVDYLFQQGFPVTGTGVSLPTVRAIQRVAYGTNASWETRPVNEASHSTLEYATSSGSQAAWAQREVDAGIGYEGDDDGDEAVGEWELFVESSEESCMVEDDMQDTQQPRLSRLCSSSNPGCEYDLLQRLYEGHIDDAECSGCYQEDMASNLEEWELRFPQLSKVEPEFTEGIEDLISGLEGPLRHTHNVSPREVRLAVEKWRPSIEKELKVVEQGFERTTIDEVRRLKASYQVQELPAKLVYTLKPPAEDAAPGSEAAKCKRKSRIVCCGNFNDQDPGDVFASGAAAESLRCVLTLTALKRWAAGGLDITGAFMLTPLPRDKVLIVITPPAILVQLGLATSGERWILTRAMYGLRQAPHLWSEFRDKAVKALRLNVNGKEWMFRQGGAEPNVWFLVECGTENAAPAGVLLIYVDDLLLLGPQVFVETMAASVQSTWKTSSLEMVEPRSIVDEFGVSLGGGDYSANGKYDDFYLIIVFHPGRAIVVRAFFLFNTTTAVATRDGKAHYNSGENYGLVER